MTAIYKRELKSFFHSFIGWIFVAATLFIMGIYFTVFNMLAGYPTISYVLQSVVFLFIITIPILTMRTLAEERKYKTDQLILTAPISVGKIVAAKYFALVTVFAIPTVIIGITPSFLALSGNFQVGLSYTALLGFFLYGCLGLAIGLLLSSLTESVVIAAVLTFVTLFLGYIMSGLCVRYLFYFCLIYNVSFLCYCVARWKTKGNSCPSTPCSLRCGCPPGERND